MTGIRENIDFFEVGVNLEKTLSETVEKLAKDQGGIHKLIQSLKESGMFIVLASYNFCGDRRFPIQMVLKSVERGNHTLAEIHFRNLVEPSITHTPFSVMSLLCGAVSDSYVAGILENLAERTAKTEECFMLVPKDKWLAHAGRYW